MATLLELLSIWACAAHACLRVHGSLLSAVNSNHFQWWSRRAAAGQGRALRCRSTVTGELRLSVRQCLDLGSYHTY